MTEEERSVAVIAKLNRATKEGEIVWSKAAPPYSLTGATNTHVSVFFRTQWKARNLGIYEERFLSWNDDESSYWNSRIVLALFDAKWENPYEFGRVAGLDELMDSVKYQVADVKNAIDDLLKD